MRAALPQTPPIQRFLVLTTQHSGSSWLTQELNAQPGVACQKELLADLDEHRLQRNASSSLKAPTWEEWVARAEAAFERVYKDALQRMPRNLTVAVGFKLMYSQVWDSRPLFMNAPPKTWGQNTRFLAWLRARNVRVLHLVRGAAILRSNDLADEAAASHVHVGRALNSVQNLTELAKLQAAFKPRKYGPSELVSKVLEMEEPVLYWRDLLALTGADHHVLLYESLLGASRALAFQSAVTYIGGPPGARLLDTREEVATGSKMNLRIHPITCEERIQDWNKLKFLLKADSLTLLSCELLASLARDKSLWT